MHSKRVFDIIASAVFLVLLAPVLAIIAALVRLVLGSPVLFIQKRPGLGGAPFRLVKFRTMRPPLANSSQTDAERMSAFGRWLRRASLDELPELWNVLRGDMSLVGPRPLLMDYLPLYSAEQMRRHAVRPGITGLAQVSGRNAIGWEQRFALDVWYVENWSWSLDLQILRRTVAKVFRGEGISQPGHVTAERFTGSMR